MIPEIGLLALILAFCIAVLTVVLPSSSMVFKLQLSLEDYRTWVSLQTVLIVVSFLCLLYALLRNDFSVIYVAQNSNTHLPWPYKIAALWGAHEGSLLLWTSILSLWTWLVAHTQRDIPKPLLARIVIVLSAINAGFLYFIVATSNPFARFFDPVPLQGADLNPLLQDPGLAIHPPLLYMGYVGFAIVFAFACTALWSNDDKIELWAKWMRPWCIAAWSFLSLGITLGSWWAYRVLGWGGWWFWDPVENASLLPWLVGAALLHTLYVAEKRRLLFNLALFLSLCGFALSLLGTFLVRSGILISAHNFASDPNRGVFLLSYLAVVVGSAFLLFTLRAPKRIQHANFNYLSREALILLNNLLLFIAMCTILLGTLYPLLLDVLKEAKISVGPPYFNTLIIPILWLLMVLMGLGIHSPWQQGSFKALVGKLWFSMLLSLCMALFISYWLRHFSWHFTLTLMLAFWVIISTLYKVYSAIRKWHLAGMALAHIGVAMTAIGIAAVTSFSTQRDLAMAIGERIIIKDYSLYFAGIQRLSGPNYQGITGYFTVNTPLQKEISLAPQRRVYTASKNMIAEAAISITPWRDYYITLGDPLPDGTWSVRFYVKPLVRWIWLGGLLMLLGGIASLIKQGNKVKR